MKPKPRPKVQDSRARQELERAVDASSQKVIATETGVRQSAISLILNRQCLPGRTIMFRLLKLGIQLAWWGEPPMKVRKAS